MIVLDENFPESQRQLLRGWRVPARQIGYDVGRKGLKDDQVIPFLMVTTNIRPDHRRRWTRHTPAS
jgi:hypothetical protein